MDGDAARAEAGRNPDAAFCARYGEAFFGAADALAEARHVFLAGNDLPARFRPGFHVAELGFGTGLNVLAAWAAWRATGLPGPLAVTSFEAHPLDAARMAAALAPFAELAPLAAPVLAAWARGARRIALPGLDLTVIEGDARAAVPLWRGRADAWFLDGFSPARNPAMWEPALLAAVAARTAPGGTCASFTAARSVRDALAAAGFAVTRAPGFGRKRHMTRGVLR